MSQLGLQVRVGCTYRVRGSRVRVTIQGGQGDLRLQVRRGCFRSVNEEGLVGGGVWCTVWSCGRGSTGDYVGTYWEGTTPLLAVVLSADAPSLYIVWQCLQSGWAVCVMSVPVLVLVNTALWWWQALQSHRHTHNVNCLLLDFIK